MSNYYEMIGLATNATVDDIRRAVDRLYNETRQDVNHPDAAVVAEVNRKLRLLEEVRATLTDSNRRAAYDAGLSRGIGGLADPAARLRQASQPPPPRIVQSPGRSRANEPEDLLACPKCRTRNPERNQYCMKCQTLLLRKCPECNELRSLVKTGICGHCGFAYDAGMRRIAIGLELIGARAQADVQQAKIVALAEEKDHKWRNMIYTGSVAFGVTVICFFLILIFESLFWIVPVAIAIALGVILVWYQWGAIEKMQGQIATEQEERAQAEQRILDLRAEHKRLGEDKHL